MIGLESLYLEAINNNTMDIANNNYCSRYDVTMCINSLVHCYDEDNLVYTEHGVLVGYLSANDKCAIFEMNLRDPSSEENNN